MPVSRWAVGSCGWCNLKVMVELSRCDEPAQVQGAHWNDGPRVAALNAAPILAVRGVFTREFPRFEEVE